MSKINELKRHVFYELLYLVGRVFIVVTYSPDVILGNRGFTHEEKEKGIVLVFNSAMRFTWDEKGINATLFFNNIAHKCFIPSENISAIYSPELNAHFILPLYHQENELKDIENLKNSKKVITVDFKNKRKIDE
ncbi:MAG: ClpXP protease specificity-enhancing factor SspB [Thermodesulfovibrionales bacterium]|nr:ClpXP protease specificity-enhancing factor SspB [Thermodesulfovibrionales bacterium]